MHTIRNRRAAKPPQPKPPQPRGVKHGLAGPDPRKRSGELHVLASGYTAQGQAPAFPKAVTIPPHRGAIARTVVLKPVEARSDVPMSAMLAAVSTPKPAVRKAAAAKPKSAKIPRKHRVKVKPKIRRKAAALVKAIPAKVAATPAIALPAPAIALPTQPEPLVIAATPKPAPVAAQVQAKRPAPATTTAPIARDRALATHREGNLLDHIAIWLAARGRAIRLAFIGKPRRAPQAKARLQPKAVPHPRRDPRQDELARLRQENRQLQLQIQALLAHQRVMSGKDEPVG